VSIYTDLKFTLSDLVAFEWIKFYKSKDEYKLKYKLAGE